jgi:ABC-type phosphate/phosphonate transport system substrate-binding protein
MTEGALIAALPMYDDPGIAGANDAFWAAIASGLRRRGVEAPATLTRGDDLAAQWRDPRILFGQTCGYPYVKELSRAVRLIATPEYDFPGCEGTAHRSFLICRTRDPRRSLEAFRGGVGALNAHDSNSGMNLFRATIAPVAGGRTFFGALVLTGSHRASVEAVADGRAELASIDCVSLGLMKRLSPSLVAQVSVVAESPSSPGLPFIASARLPEATVALVREALLEALGDPAVGEARATLGLKGARPTTPSDYDRVLEIERGAEAEGYPRLA